MACSGAVGNVKAAPEEQMTAAEYAQAKTEPATGLMGSLGYSKAQVGERPGSSRSVTARERSAMRLAEVKQAKGEG